MDLKTQYELFCKKYTLPSYDELNDEFELLYFQHVIEIRYPLRFVRRRILDKMSWFIHFFQNIVHPINGSMISMEENTFFTDEEKEELVRLIKQMISFEREGLVLDIQHKDEDDAAFIMKSYTLWKDYKPTLLSFLKKLQDGWKTTKKQEDTGHYFG